MAIAIYVPFEALRLGLMRQGSPAETAAFNYYYSIFSV
jgi:hypothetical protein